MPNHLECFLGLIFFSIFSLPIHHHILSVVLILSNPQPLKDLKDKVPVLLLQKGFPLITHICCHCSDIWQRYKSCRPPRRGRSRSCTRRWGRFPPQVSSLLLLCCPVDNAVCPRAAVSPRLAGTACSGWTCCLSRVIGNIHISLSLDLLQSELLIVMSVLIIFQYANSLN